MAYPVGLPTRDVSFGKAVVFESGTPLAMKVTVKASRSLVHRPTGTPLVATTTVFISDAEGSGSLELPVTDSPDMGLGDGTPIVLGPNEVTHTYTATIDYTTALGVSVSKVTKGPFTIPSSA